MKRLGQKKQKVLAKHQDCSICQPETKGGKALERQRAEKEISAQLEPETQENSVRYEKCPSGSCYWVIPLHGKPGHFNGVVPSQKKESK